MTIDAPPVLINGKSDLAHHPRRVFVAFLRNALAAREEGKTEAHDIWLQAATHLYPVEDNTFDALAQEAIVNRRPDDAIEFADTVSRLQRGCSAAHFRLGYLLQQTGRHGEAIAPYRRAYALDQDFPSLRNNLAAALTLTEPDGDEALDLLEAAVLADPADENAWINLVPAYRTRMRIEDALAAGVRAVELAPGNVMALNNYSRALMDAQRLDDATHFAEQALSIVPTDPVSRFNLGILYLTRGNFAQGWRLYEARWQGSGELKSARRVLHSPAWTGESLSGKNLLVSGEQGMGDLILFSRYVPLLADYVHRQGGRLAWNSVPQMGELLRRSLGEQVDSYFSDETGALPAFDHEITLPSLPLLFNTDEATIPTTASYLSADANAVSFWRDRLASEKRLKVGLAWTGSLTHQRNRFRRVGLDRYASHFGALSSSVAFYSLQPGAGGEVAQARRNGFTVDDHTTAFNTFDDTAAFIDALDLVITVCTSVAHLSCALGKRTWVLLDTHPYWTWMLGRKDSPWYPTATLYRQEQFAQWDPVFHEVTRDLGELASGCSQVATGSDENVSMSFPAVALCPPSSLPQN